MKQQFKELAIKAGLYVNVNGNPWPKNMNGEDIEGAYQKFAELVVKETLEVARAGIEYGPGMEDAVYKYFGVEEQRGWVCPKCKADRTKIACPLGFGAQVDGRCPMTAEAQ